jgi:proteasome lid subunit RPN8/RPN11
VFWAIVHSHTHTAAVPSQTDLGLAFYPDALYVVVSLSLDEADPTTGAFSLRAWRITDGAAKEVTIR